MRYIETYIKVFCFVLFCFFNFKLYLVLTRSESVSQAQGKSPKREGGQNKEQVAIGTSHPLSTWPFWNHSIFLDSVFWQRCCCFRLWSLTQSTLPTLRSGEKNREIEDKLRILVLKYYLAILLYLLWFPAQALPHLSNFLTVLLFSLVSPASFGASYSPA